MKLRSLSNWLILSIVLVVALLAGTSVMAKKSEIAVGDKAPDFSLPDQNGAMVSLKDYAGKQAVVLYFYPKDNTSVCTKEACLFRDDYLVFHDAGAEVLGVSSDSVDSHKDFATAHKLPFKLLSDSKGELRKTYGVPSVMGISPGRVTYVIDKDGTVRLVFNSMLDAKKHVDEAIKVLHELNENKKTS